MRTREEIVAAATERTGAVFSLLAGELADIIDAAGDVLGGQELPDADLVAKQAKYSVLGLHETIPIKVAADDVVALAAIL